jgi:hypothetical protein
MVLHTIAPEQKASNSKIEVGTVSTVAAVDTIQTRLKKVDVVILTPQGDPVAGAQEFTATPGQNGQFSLKTWKATAAGDTSLIAGTTFGQSIGYLAIGR